MLVEGVEAQAEQGARVRRLKDRQPTVHEAIQRQRDRVMKARSHSRATARRLLTGTPSVQVQAQAAGRALASNKEIPVLRSSRQQLQY